MHPNDSLNSLTVRWRHESWRNRRVRGRPWRKSKILVSSVRSFPLGSTHARMSLNTPVHLYPAHVHVSGWYSRFPLVLPGWSSSPLGSLTFPCPNEQRRLWRPSHFATYLFDIPHSWMGVPGRKSTGVHELSGPSRKTAVCICVSTRLVWMVCPSLSETAGLAVMCSGVWIHCGRIGGAIVWVCGSISGWIYWDSPIQELLVFVFWVKPEFQYCKVPLRLERVHVISLTVGQDRIVLTGSTGVGGWGVW